MYTRESIARCVPISKNACTSAWMSFLRSFVHEGKPEMSLCRSSKVPRWFTSQRAVSTVSRTPRGMILRRFYDSSLALETVVWTEHFSRCRLYVVYEIAETLRHVTNNIVVGKAWDIKLKARGTYRCIHVSKTIVVLQRQNTRTSWIYWFSNKHKAFGNLQ